jgi:signal peptidase I
LSQEKAKEKNRFRDFIEGLLVALIAALFIRQFIFS